ncbi:MULTISPECIES: hypothetical protein [Rhizobium/Agrobacterium group]|uniref:hypothetical protein n=1 Tax=Rhizobium oryzihabitans TaxID=2267833 RepID=UPI004033B665
MSETEASFQLENILAELFSFARRFMFLLGSGLVLGLVSGTALFSILPTTYYGAVEVRMAGYSPILNMEEIVTIQNSQQSLNRLSNGNSYPKTVVEACGTVDDPDAHKIATAIARQAKILSPDALRIQIDLTERDRIEPCLAAVVKILADWQSTLMERRIGSLRDKIAQVVADIEKEGTGAAVPSATVGVLAPLAAEQLVPIQVLLAASAHPLIWPTEVVQPVTVWQQSVVSLIVKLIFGGAMIGLCAALLAATLWSRLRRNKIA